MKIGKEIQTSPSKSSMKSKIASSLTFNKITNSKRFSFFGEIGMLG